MANPFLFKENKFIQAGGSVANLNGFMYTGLIPVVSPNVYTYSGTNTYGAINIRIHGYDVDGKWLKQIQLDDGGSRNTRYSHQINISEDNIKFIRISTAKCEDFQVELGDMATDYDNGVETSISFPQTIYGGYVDLVKGEIVEEWVKVTLDGVTNNMKVNSDYSDNTYLITGVVYVKPPGKGDNYFVSNLYCDSMPLVADAVKGNNLPQDFPFIKTISNGELYLRIYHDYIANHPDLDTKQKRYDYANAYLMEHNVDVAYQLKTPIHHQFDSQTITTLRGLNNVFSDANGSVELTYWTH